jgi:hypothetical protein
VPTLAPALQVTCDVCVSFPFDYKPTTAHYVCDICGKQACCPDHLIFRAFNGPVGHETDVRLGFCLHCWGWGVGLEEVEEP